MALWRFDCGRFENVPIDDLSETGRYKGRRRTLTDSCYLIRHGADYLLWDAGYPTTMRMNGPGFTISGPKESVASQLSRIGVRPAQVRYLALSHWHDDHIGQAADFPKATLLIGAADWETLKHPPPDAETASLRPWLSGGAPVEALAGDRDVFGDGAVTMIATPGHTRGHHSLVVRLPKTGVVMLTGDLCHVRESCEHSVVPLRQEDRAQTLASYERFNRLAAREHATVIVGHEIEDVGKLPTFPAAAR